MHTRPKRTRLFQGVLLTLVPLFAAMQSEAETHAANSPSNEAFLALVDLNARPDPINSNPPEEACKDFADRRYLCVAWREQFIAHGRVIQFLGPDALAFPNRFRLELFQHPTSLKGRYLAIYRHDGESGEGNLIWLASKQKGKWCLPADLVRSTRERVKPPVEFSQPDGSWCITDGEASKLRWEGERKAVATSPWSFVVGRLGRQKDTGRCSNEDCWDISMAAQLSSAQTLVGKDLPSRFQLNHWAHARFLGRPMVSAPVSRSENGSYFTPGRVRTIENGRVCLDESFFYPSRNGMAVPKDARIDEDGEVCFNVR